MENKKKKLKLQKLIGLIYNSKKSKFYKNIWKNLYFKNRKIDFVNLPIIGAKDIIKCKFDKRIYIKNGLFVKIVYHENIPFLIARTKSDISKENYGEISYERPLVFFESSHESIEKSIWLSSKKILPILEEENTNLTLMISGRYGIDSILGDSKSIARIIPDGSRHFDYRKIKNVTIMDCKLERSFIKFLSDIFPSAKIEIIISLPETGPLGFVCQENKKNNLIFHPPDDTIIEVNNGYLVATRLILLPTPIIKYKTGIKIAMEKRNCSCKSELSFSLQN
ncbi:MAG: hypothetical protein AAB513_00420 [Patescibacteria group bacterium]